MLNFPGRDVGVEDPAFICCASRLRMFTADNKGIGVESPPCYPWTFSLSYDPVAVACLGRRHLLRCWKQSWIELHLFWRWPSGSHDILATKHADHWPLSKPLGLAASAPIRPARHSTFTEDVALPLMNHLIQTSCQTCKESFPSTTICPMRSSIKRDYLYLVVRPIPALAPGWIP